MLTFQRKFPGIFERLEEFRGIHRSFLPWSKFVNTHLYRSTYTYFALSQSHRISQTQMHELERWDKDLTGGTQDAKENFGILRELTEVAPSQQ